MPRLRPAGWPGRPTAAAWQEACSCWFPPRLHAEDRRPRCAEPSTGNTPAPAVPGVTPPRLCAAAHSAPASRFRRHVPAATQRARQAMAESEEGIRDAAQVHPHPLKGDDVIRGTAGPRPLKHPAHVSASHSGGEGCTRRDTRRSLCPLMPLMPPQAKVASRRAPRTRGVDRERSLGRRSVRCVGGGPWGGTTGPSGGTCAAGAAPQPDTAPSPAGPPPAHIGASGNRPSQSRRCPRSAADPSSGSASPPFRRRWPAASVTHQPAAPYRAVTTPANFNKSVILKSPRVAPGSDGFQLGSCLR